MLVYYGCKMWNIVISELEIIGGFCSLLWIFNILIFVTGITSHLYPGVSLDLFHGSWDYFLMLEDKNGYLELPGWLQFTWVWVFSGDFFHSFISSHFHFHVITQNVPHGMYVRKLTNIVKHHFSMDLGGIRGRVVACWTAGQLVERSILHQRHDS